MQQWLRIGWHAIVLASLGGAIGCAGRQTKHEYRCPCDISKETGHSRADSSPEKVENLTSRRTANAECVGDIQFADPQMELVVRKNLGKPYGPITATEAISVDVLVNEWEGSGIAVSDLLGIECFSSLKIVWIKNSVIKDLTPLTRLSALIDLDLTGDRISDITALGELTQLKTLRLDDNDISDVSPLTNLQQLENLYLDDNKVADASSLAGLSQLKDLYLNRNQIRDLRFVKSLNRLERLSLEGNTLTDIGPITGALPKLHVLALSGNKIKDLSPISKTSKDRKSNGYVTLRDIGIDCDRERSVLTAISILWKEMNIECDEFNTEP